ncbi:Bug family tripartite tricarboxylate transporter substrate binding protein [Muricoccus radiodurans]|uniref:Bug family tripartite tricarboxylate transporter substrate binding protein n=1 Tax=Muricoccus radiodurans TaxID=2231721 RepID=UPI003CFB8CF4
MIHRPTRRATLAAAALLADGRAARAQAWPDRPIRFIVPFAPGGSTDLIARLVAEGLGERLGQPVIVENRGGAGATLGTQLCAQSRPDGTTVMLSNIASHAISPALYPNPGYDPVRDFTHVALLVTNPSVIEVNPRFEAQTLQELIALSKSRPDGVDYATSGSGSSNHMLMVRLAQITGARFNHVPYRGAGPAMTDVIGGTVPVMADTLPSSIAHIQARSVRALAVSGEARSPLFPDVPTLRESGVDLVNAPWYGLSGPANLPAPIVERLAAETRQVLASDRVRARLAEIGSDVGQMTPAEYTEHVRVEAARWAPVVRASGATFG